MLCHAYLHYILAFWILCSTYIINSVSLANYITYFGRNSLVSADTEVFWPKSLHFGRNKIISAEIRIFRQNIRFRPNFGFSEWPVSVFGVSVKNLFRSDTSITLQGDKEER